MSETKLSEARLVRKFGRRETHRLIADKLVWERLTRLGLRPRVTPKPSPLV